MLNRRQILAWCLSCWALGAVALSAAQPAADPAGLPEGFSIEDFKFRQDQLDQIQAHLRQEIAPTSKSPHVDLSSDIKDAIRKASTGDPRFLSSLLASQDPGLVEFALTGLAVQFGPAARSAAPRIFPLLDDSRELGRIARLAAEALGKIGAGDVTIAKVLAARLVKTSDPDEWMRSALLDALGRVGPAATPFSAQLRPFLRDRSIKVQYRTLLALGAIEPSGPLSVDQWLDGTPLSRRTAGQLAGLLAAVGPQQARSEEIAALMVKEALQSGPSYWTPLALDGIQRSKLVSPDSVRLALESLGGTDAFLNVKASECLAHIEPSATAAVPAIGSMLKHPNAKVRTQAALTLKRFGPVSASEAGGVITALGRCDGTSSEGELSAYLESLQSMGVAAGPAAAEPLVALMQERSPLFRNRDKLRLHHIRAFMLVTLAEIGTPRSALPLILDGLANSENNNPYVFAAAARAAASLGPEARATVPLLLRAFNGGLRDEFLSFETLGSHRSSTGEYTSCLVEAIRALAKMGTEARDAVPHLQAILAQPSIRLNGEGRLQRLPDPSEEARKAIKAIAS